MSHIRILIVLCFVVGLVTSVEEIIKPDLGVTFSNIGKIHQGIVYHYFVLGLELPHTQVTGNDTIEFSDMDCHEITTLTTIKYQWKTPPHRQLFATFCLRSMPYLKAIVQYVKDYEEDVHELFEENIMAIVSQYRSHKFQNQNYEDLSWATLDDIYRNEHHIAGYSETEQHIQAIELRLQEHSGNLTRLMEGLARVIDISIQEEHEAPSEVLANMREIHNNMTQTIQTINETMSEHGERFKRWVFDLVQTVLSGVNTAMQYKQGQVMKKAVKRIKSLSKKVDKAERKVHFIEDKLYSVARHTSSGFKMVAEEFEDVRKGLEKAERKFEKQLDATTFNMYKVHVLQSYIASESLILVGKRLNLYQDLKSEASKFLSALDSLARGYLSQEIVAPYELQDMISQIIEEIEEHHPELEVVFKSVQEYYNMPLVEYSYIGDRTIAIIIPMMLRTKELPPMNMYTVKAKYVPYNLNDNSDNQENAYTILDLQAEIIALDETRVRSLAINEANIQNCVIIGDDYYCTDIYLNQYQGKQACEVAIFRDDTPDVIDELCNFLYVYNIIPLPEVVTGAEEVLIANLPLPWKFTCVPPYVQSNIISGPSYSVLRRNIFCKCTLKAGKYDIYANPAHCVESTLPEPQTFQVNKALFLKFGRQIPQSTSDWRTEPIHEFFNYPLIENKQDEVMRNVDSENKEIKQSQNYLNLHSVADSVLEHSYIRNSGTDTSLDFDDWFEEGHEEMAMLFFGFLATILIVLITIGIVFILIKHKYKFKVLARLYNNRRSELATMTKAGLMAAVTKASNAQPINESPDTTDTMSFLEAFYVSLMITSSLAIIYIIAKLIQKLIFKLRIEMWNMETEAWGCCHFYMQLVDHTQGYERLYLGTTKALPTDFSFRGKLIFSNLSFENSKWFGGKVKILWYGNAELYRNQVLICPILEARVPLLKTSKIRRMVTDQTIMVSLVIKHENQFWHIRPLAPYKPLRPDNDKADGTEQHHEETDSEAHYIPIDDINIPTQRSNRIWSAGEVINERVHDLTSATIHMFQDGTDMIDDTYTKGMKAHEYPELYTPMQVSISQWLEGMHQEFILYTQFKVNLELKSMLSRMESWLLVHIRSAHDDLFKAINDILEDEIKTHPCNQEYVRTYQEMIFSFHEIECLHPDFGHMGLTTLKDYETYFMRKRQLYSYESFQAYSAEFHEFLRKRKYVEQPNIYAVSYSSLQLAILSWIKGKKLDFIGKRKNPPDIALYKFFCRMEEYMITHVVSACHSLNKVLDDFLDHEIYKGSDLGYMFQNHFNKYRYYSRWYWFKKKDIHAGLDTIKELETRFLKHYAPIDLSNGKDYLEVFNLYLQGKTDIDTARSPTGSTISSSSGHFQGKDTPDSKVYAPNRSIMDIQKDLQDFTKYIEEINSHLPAEDQLVTDPFGQSKTNKEKAQEMEQAISDILAIPEDKTEVSKPTAQTEVASETSDSLSDVEPYTKVRFRRDEKARNPIRYKRYRRSCSPMPKHKPLKRLGSKRDCHYQTTILRCERHKVFFCDDCPLKNSKMITPSFHKMHTYVYPLRERHIAKMNRRNKMTIGEHNGEQHGKLTIISKCKHGLLLCNTCLPSTWVKYESCDSDLDMTIKVDKSDPVEFSLTSEDSHKVRCFRHQRFDCPRCDYDYEYPRKRSIYSGSDEEEDSDSNRTRLVKLKRPTNLKLMTKCRPKSPENKDQLKEAFDKLALKTPANSPTPSLPPKQGNTSGYSGDESEESWDDYGLVNLFKEPETIRGKDGCEVLKNYYYHTIYYKYEEQPDYKFNPKQLDKCPNTYREYVVWCNNCSSFPLGESKYWHPLVPRVHNEQAAICYGLDGIDKQKFPTIRQQLEEASIKSFIAHFGMTEKWARYLLQLADDYPDEFSGRNRPRPPPEEYDPPSDFFLRDFYGNYVDPDKDSSEELPSPIVNHVDGYTYEPEGYNTDYLDNLGTGLGPEWTEVLRHYVPLPVFLDPQVKEQFKYLKSCEYTEPTEKEIYEHTKDVPISTINQWNVFLYIGNKSEYKPLNPHKLPGFYKDGIFQILDPNMKQYYDPKDLVHCNEVCGNFSYDEKYKDPEYLGEQLALLSNKLVIKKVTPPEEELKE